MILYNCSNGINKKIRVTFAIGGVDSQSDTPPTPLVGVVYW